MDILIPFTKVWNQRDRTYRESTYYLNPNSMTIEGIEPCYVENGSQRNIPCTKLYYPGRYMIILGTPDEFLEKCRQANVAYGLLNDLYREGVTIKEFMNKTERLNGVHL
jgi:hypothetical protein